MSKIQYIDNIPMPKEIIINRAVFNEDLKQEILDRFIENSVRIHNEKVFKNYIGKG